MGMFTKEGESYLRKKLAAVEVPKVTHYVLAYVPDLDHSVAPSSNETIPLQGLIVGEYEVTQEGSLNANQVVYSLVLDSSIGDFTFNWVGLKTDDGSLLAVEYIAPIPKTRYDGEQVGNNITRNMVIEFTGAQQATQITVSAETWQIDFSARLNQIDENQRLANKNSYGESTFFNDSFQVVREGAETKVKAGLAFIEGVRVDIAEDVNLGDISDRAIWLDAALINDAGVVAGKADFKVSTLGAIQVNYFSTENHYLVKIAVLDYNGVVTDLRNVLDDSEEGAVLGLKKFASKEVAALSAVISSMFAGQVSTFAGTKEPDGWLKAKGQEVLRSAYPYLWSYAVSSGNISLDQGVKAAGQFGVGDGATTFVLPDLRGQHLRYWDDGRGVDDGRKIGSEQEDDIKQHKHGANASRDGSHKHNASTGYDGEHTHTATTAASGEHRHRLNIKDADDASSGGGHRYRPNSGGTELTDYAGSHGHKITVKSSSTHNHSVNVLSEGTHGHTITIANKGIAENRVKNIALMACIKY